MRCFAILAALPLLAIAANLPLSGGRRLAGCTDTCGNDNGASSYLGACKNGSKCSLTADSCIYCTGCPAGYSGFRCEVGPAGTPAPTPAGGTGICANNGAADPLGPCKNGSVCTLNSAGQIWCQNCPAGYSGYRCEIAPAGATPAPTPASGTGICANNGAADPLGACKNGSICTLNSAGQIWCQNCPAGYSGYRCEIAPAGATPAPTPTAGTGICADNGAADPLGPCLNGSTCSLNSAGQIWCQNCPAGYSGYRCEIPPAGQQSCANNGASSDLGACKNGSTCQLNSAGYIYCTGCPAGYSGQRCEIAPGSTPCGLGDVWNVAYCTADQVCLEQCGKACGYSCQPKTAPGCNPVCDPATQVCEYAAYLGTYSCKTKPTGN